MRKPWWPKLIIEVGDERHEMKSFMATEMEQIARVTRDALPPDKDGRPRGVNDRLTLYAQLLAENPTVWRALLQVLRKREGSIQNFDEIDVDLDSSQAWCVDDTGREVDLKMSAQPCAFHKGSGLQQGCENCGEMAADTDRSGQMIWFYVDNPDELVPTSRARLSLTEPES